MLGSRKPKGIVRNAWKYVIEVQDAAKPADVTGYR
jgi:hypothetical protein